MNARPSNTMSRGWRLDKSEASGSASSPSVATLMILYSVGAPSVNALDSEKSLSGTSGCGFDIFTNETRRHS